MKKIFILTAIIILSVNAFAQLDEDSTKVVSDPVNPEPSFTKLNNLGVKAITEKSDDELAISYFERAIAKNSMCSECRINLGRAKLRQGKSDEAIRIFSDVLRTDPKSKDAYSSLGEAFSRAGKDKQGIEAYDKAVQNGASDDPVTLTNYAISLNNEREYKKALNILDAALKLDPNLAEAHTNRGTVLFNMGKIKKALDAFREADRLSPNNYTISNNLGVTYDTLGKNKMAQKYYQTAIELNPDFGIAQYNLAANYLENGKRTEAYKGLNALKSIDNDLANELQQMIWGRFVINVSSRKIQ
ncbi:MAG: tetratricopeptide repeat protein [Pyrinomonadaceae bacterium]